MKDLFEKIIKELDEKLEVYKPGYKYADIKKGTNSEVMRMLRNLSNDESKSFEEYIHNNYKTAIDWDGCYRFIIVTLRSRGELRRIDFCMSGDGLLNDTTSISMNVEAVERRVALLNTTILTVDGEFSLKTISLEEAKRITDSSTELISAIGHQSTADILTALLDVKIEMNRINFIQEPDIEAICFKLKGRPEEGKILTVEDIEKIGYDFKLLKMKKNKKEER